MSDPPTFGSTPPGIVCRSRSAAYAVFRDAAGRVAVVLGRSAYWLPGGGDHSGETPEETVLREVREELGRSCRLLGRIGTAVQFFHAADDGCWYEMTAVFFRAEFLGEPFGVGEHQLYWLDPERESESFFHACHAWAVAHG